MNTQLDIERNPTDQKLLKAYRSANLHEILAHGLSVVHGVESRDFVNSHRRHLQKPGNLVHDADARETMLALAEIEQGHDSSLFILWGVAVEDFVNDLQVVLVELERDGRVVVGFVAVLKICVGDRIRHNSTFKAIKSPQC
jgi:hypothetical protein